MFHAVAATSHTSIWIYSICAHYAIGIFTSKSHNLCKTKYNILHKCHPSMPKDMFWDWQIIFPQDACNYCQSLTGHNYSCQTL